MKSISLPFGISKLAGTSFYAVKITAKISNANRLSLFNNFPNLSAVEIPRKDGKPSAIHKFTMICEHKDLWNFYDELKLAIIDRKIAALYDERMVIIKRKHGIQECEQEKENFVKNPYAMTADKPPHVVGWIDLSKPSPVDDDVEEDTPLVGFSVNYEAENNDDLRDLHDELPW